MANLWDDLKFHAGIAGDNFLEKSTIGKLLKGTYDSTYRLTHPTGDYNPTQAEDAFNVAGSAMVGGMPFAPSGAGTLTAGIKKLPLEKAAEQGYHLDMPLYHGTSSIEDFDAFKPNAVRNDGRRTSGDSTMSFATNPEDASRFAFGEEGSHPEWWMPKTPMPRGRVIPAYVRGNLWDYRNPEHVNLAFEHLKNKYPGQTGWTTDWYKQQLNTGHWGIIEHDLGKDFFKSNGFTGAHVTEADAKNVIMFDPTAIRGKFAKFNKKDMKSSNLLASGLLGALLLKDGQQNELE